MSFPDLYILRHGETVWNRENRMQGHLDSPLTQRGLGQAADQRRILAGRDLTGFSFLVSPLGRAVQTAGIALGGLATTVRTDDRLMEIDVGRWQGLLRQDLVEGDLVEGPDGDPSLYERAPGGEGFDGLEARARSFLDDLSGPAVLVTHGIASRMLRMIATGAGREALLTMPGGQGNVFFVSDGRQTELR
ncbi:histidine phosphatase family protein [Salipiger sp. IMCC34102]|uniref:histidine phosphatase family protein n=1 Tax=Salipiger sp. IMCC34102 TaxID=2510647 RepID=UPI00101C1650|nr:histidine phosphatase family protein [Salipiger sp. IMCC34102]RYH02822.1 histidine phosphatase family protein [Salipiger sp. IMCC34102]